MNWEAVRQFVEEQSVVGLLAAGIEHLRMQDSGFKIPKQDALQSVAPLVIYDGT